MGDPIPQPTNVLPMSGYNRANLVNEITTEFESTTFLLSPECCIYKVPNALRSLNEEAYTPQVISIGPFHHGNENLQTMEKYKVQCLKEFIPHTNVNLETLVHFVEELEEKIRQCYAYTISLGKGDFLKMILYDACFIIQLFVKVSRKELPWTTYDHILLKSWLGARIQLDFLLLENQLPFFIVEDLFNSVHASFPCLPSFLELTFQYFEFYNFQSLSPNVGPKIKHFLDLLRKFYLPPPNTLLERKCKIVKHMYSATELDEAGLKFVVHPTSRCLLDIHYKKGVLQIPHFILDNCTELYARNLMALEQCHYPNEAYVTDYFLLLHFLIKSEKDVHLLGRKGIIVNGLDNNDATFINQLGTKILYSAMSSEHYDVCENLVEFYEDPSHGWLASLRRDYLRTPWMIASTTAAITLLILTSIQTICSIISIIKSQGN